VSAEIRRRTMRCLSKIASVMAIGLAMQQSMIATAQSAPRACQLNIVSPVNGSTVVPFTPITGQISDSTSAMSGGNVWAIVHPDGGFYWVQERGKVSGGQWRAASQFGDPTTPPGFHFEVMAVVAPTIALRAGDRLRDFPTAACSSNVIDVYMK
jgi:hypothetical protein